LYERAKMIIRELTKNIRREMSPGLEKPFAENERLLQDSLEKRMEQLQGFIEKVEESQAR
jgi:hypothetical protein